MADMIKSDYALTKVAENYAADIFAELQDEHGKNPESFEDYFSDAAHSWADQSEHVIYTARAIAICGNCDTDAGEEWLSDIYGKPFDGCETFAEVCTRLAFAELYCRIQDELQKLKDNWEEEEE